MFESIKDINLIVVVAMSLFPILSFIVGRYTTKVKEDTTINNKLDVLIKETSKIDRNMETINNKIAEFDKRILTLEIIQGLDDKKNKEDI